MNLALIIALVAAVLAGLLHVFIFYIESLAWAKMAPKVFSIAEDNIENTKEMAYNQGFYNLFLAIMALVGAAVLPVNATVGLTLVLAGCGSMAAAAAVLFLSSPEKRPAAIKQGLFPIIACVAAVAALV